MSGIDRADQMMSYYPMPRKCMLWYIKVFFLLVDICLWNSNYLYNLQVSTTSHLEFGRYIITSLFGVQLNQRSSYSPKSFTINETQSDPLHNIQKVEKRKGCRVINKNVYPNPFKLLQVALPISSASCERSFSAMRRIKSWTRTTTGQEKLSDLSIIHIESDIVIDNDIILNKFAENKRTLSLNF
ncbi:hypothetical protein QTP88_020130 [Uroleucon formosanum]